MESTQISNNPRSRKNSSQSYTPRCTPQNTIKHRHITHFLYCSFVCSEFKKHKGNNERWWCIAITIFPFFFFSFSRGKRGGGGYASPRTDGHELNIHGPIIFNRLIRRTCLQVQREITCYCCSYWVRERANGNRFQRASRGSILSSMR